MRERYTRQPFLLSLSPRFTAEVPLLGRRRKADHDAGCWNPRNDVPEDHCSDTTTGSHSLRLSVTWPAAGCCRSQTRYLFAVSPACAEFIDCDPSSGWGGCIIIIKNEAIYAEISLVFFAFRNVSSRTERFKRNVYQANANTRDV